MIQIKEITYSLMQTKLVSELKGQSLNWYKLV